MKPIFKNFVKSAHQWHKNGDHPNDYTKTHQGFENGELRYFSPEERKAKYWEGDIVRYYRNPDIGAYQICAHCGKTMHEHGWIDDGTKQGSNGNEVYGQTVCPGDYILEFPGSVYLPVKPNVFENLFFTPPKQGKTAELPSGKTIAFTGDEFTYTGDFIALLQAFPDVINVLAVFDNGVHLNGQLLENNDTIIRRTGTGEFFVCSYKEQQRELENLRKFHSEIFEDTDKVTK